MVRRTFLQTKGVIEKNTYLNSNMKNYCLHAVAWFYSKIYKQMRSRKKTLQTILITEFAVEFI